MGPWRGGALAALAEGPLAYNEQKRARSAVSGRRHTGRSERKHTACQWSRFHRRHNQMLSDGPGACQAAFSPGAAGSKAAAEASFHLPVYDMRRILRGSGQQPALRRGHACPRGPALGRPAGPRRPSSEPDARRPATELESLMEPTKILLDESELPRQWYNLAVDLIDKAKKARSDPGE